MRHNDIGAQYKLYCTLSKVSQERLYYQLCPGILSVPLVLYNPSALRRWASGPAQTAGLGRRRGVEVIWRPRGYLQVWDCRRLEKDVSFRSRLTYASQGTAVKP